MLDYAENKGIKKGIKKGIREGTRALIESCRELGQSYDSTLQRIKMCIRDSNSAIELSMEEMEKYSCAKAWIDVCKLPETT